MDEVAESGREVVITKRGRPVARLVPVAEAGARDIVGCMRGTVTVLGDIVSPLGEPWEADR
jgi:antitoxin (DNA-binding transcriptional repressor) of toxin-antitoxin stability system